MMRKIERENTGLLQAGQDLVVAGYAGLAGTSKAGGGSKGRRMSRWFSDEYMEEIAALRRFARKVGFWRPAVPQNGNRQVRAAF